MSEDWQRGWRRAYVVDHLCAALSLGGSRIERGGTLDGVSVLHAHTAYADDVMREHKRTTCELAILGLISEGVLAWLDEPQADAPSPASFRVRYRRFDVPVLIVQTIA